MTLSVDLFAENVPHDKADAAYAVMALCPQHEFYVTTSSGLRAMKYIERPWRDMADGRRGLGDSMNRWSMAETGRPVWPSVSYGMIEHRGWPLPNVTVWVAPQTGRARRGNA